MPLEFIKRNENINEIKESDLFETPKYALPMLLKYVPQNWRIWESACGSGRLVKYLQEFGYSVSYFTDLQMGSKYNYFNILNINKENYNLENNFCVFNEDYDIEITNIPFSIQEKWIRKALERNHPFAFLIPYKSLEKKMSQLTREYNLQIIKPDERIAFYTPHEGWYRHEGIWNNSKCMYKQKEFFEICPKCGGIGNVKIIKSSPQILTMWITYKLNLPERFIMVSIEEDIKKYPR